MQLLQAAKSQEPASTMQRDWMPPTGRRGRES